MKAWAHLLQKETGRSGRNKQRSSRRDVTDYDDDDDDDDERPRRRSDNTRRRRLIYSPRGTLSRYLPSASDDDDGRPRRRSEKTRKEKASLFTWWNPITLSSFGIG